MIIVSLNNSLADREEIDDLFYKIFSLANNFLSAYFILNDEILSKNIALNILILVFGACYFWIIIKLLKLFINLASSWIFLFEFWWEITFSLDLKIIIPKLFQTS